MDVDTDANTIMDEETQLMGIVGGFEMFSCANNVECDDIECNDVEDDESIEPLVCDAEANGTDEVVQDMASPMQCLPELQEYAATHNCVICKTDNDHVLAQYMSGFRQKCPDMNKTLIMRGLLLSCVHPTSHCPTSTLIN